MNTDKKSYENKQEPLDFSPRYLKKNTYDTNHAFNGAFTVFLICLGIFGIMYLAINSDSIGLPGISRLIQKSPAASAFNPFRGKQNILIMGVDSNGKGSDPFEGTRTDTILLASIDKFGKSVNFLSIPRDSKVYLANGKGTDKINAAHALGGSELTIKTIENTFGVNIDHYIVINLSGVRAFVKAIGGIKINVEKRMYYVDKSGGLYVDLYPGYQTLNAKQAEGYLRFRHDAVSDIGRTARQQRVIKGVAKKLKSPEIIPKIPEIIHAVKANIRTDMNPYELTKLATLAKQTKLENIQSATLPGKPSNNAYISYWILDPGGTQNIIDRLVYREEPPAPRRPMTVTLNYSAKYKDSISSIEEILKEQGFEIKHSVLKRNVQTGIIAHSNAAGFYPAAKLKKKIPGLKSAAFILDQSIYSGDTDYTIILSD